MESITSIIDDSRQCSATSKLLFNYIGIASNDVGIGKDGKPKDLFEKGMAFHAKCTKAN